MGGCAGGANSTPIQGNGDQDAVGKGVTDTWQYSTVTLPNGIRVVFVHDTAAQREAVLLDIDAGTEFDAHPGTANFLKYVMRMGTGKYAGKTEYKDFLATLGGSTNAFSSMANTTYYYDVPVGIEQPAFVEAMDRFSQFFIDPLILDSDVGSEIDAVEEEYQRCKATDLWRQAMVQKSYCHPQHPLAKFPIGNKETLTEQGVDIRAEAMRFFRSHFVPANMVLVVYTPRDTQVLVKAVGQVFGSIQGSSAEKVARQAVGTQPYFPEVFSKVVWVKSVEERRELSIKYVLPEGCSNVRTAPELCLAELLSYCGDDSLVHYLREKGLVTDLGHKFYYDYNYKYGELIIRVRLTPKGLQKHREVITTILAYVRVVRRDRVNMIDVIKTMVSLAAHFDDCPYKKSTLSHFMRSLAHGLRLHGPRSMISHGAVIEVANDDHTMAFHRMLGDNFLVTVLAPQFEDALTSDVQREKWFGTEYVTIDYTRDEEVTKEVMDRFLWINFPPMNRFTKTHKDVKRGSECMEMEE